MALNIKNERVHELAREAAHRSGRSQTSVIEEALERYLAALPASGDSSVEARAARVRQWAAEYREGLPGGVGDLRREVDDLYREDGLYR